MKRILTGLVLLVFVFGIAACTSPEEVTCVTTIPIETESVPSTEVPIAEVVFSYDKLKNHIFVFSSGTGGWQTTLQIAPDGSFSGSWEDSNMGESGEGYQATQYCCNFTRRFGQPEYVNAYTFSLPFLELEPESSSEEVKDNIRYCYGGEPYGLEGTDALLLYLPGAPLAELPGYFLQWVIPGGSSETELSFYGLYNETQENGFSSYDEIAALRKAVAAAEKQDASLMDAVTQVDMNMDAYSRYELWDGLLNRIWKHLMARMTGTEKQQLIHDELAWIQNKELAVEEAGKELEGGSLYPTVTSSTAANWTRERVYVLMDLLERIA